MITCVLRTKGPVMVPVPLLALFMSSSDGRNLKSFVSPYRSGMMWTDLHGRALPDVVMHLH